MSSVGILLVTASKKLGESRWPRVDGKPHTAMTFAGTIVGRQPSWGCLGGGGAWALGAAGWGEGGRASSGPFHDSFRTRLPGFPLSDEVRCDSDTMSEIVGRGLAGHCGNAVRAFGSVHLVSHARKRERCVCDNSFARKSVKRFVNATRVAAMYK